MSNLRKWSDDAPMIEQSQLMTLVRVRGGVMEFANAQGEKTDWLADRRDEDIIGVVWTGQWKSDMFALPERQPEAAKVEAAPAVTIVGIVNIEEEDQA